MNRKLAGGLALGSLGILVVAGMLAPEHLPPADLGARFLSPSEAPPLGTDGRGKPLLDYALQGAQVVAIPSLAAALVVMFLATVGGLLACAGSGRAAAVSQAIGEIVGSLPRLVVVLVVALLLTGGARVTDDPAGLMPIALTWAFLAAPGGMDEAAAVASRLGGSRFVEALRAHGFSGTRIYLYHLVGLNLRPVVVRHGVETFMQVTFLEIALSYLATMPPQQASFTHPASLHSWAEILYMGYRWILGESSFHALALGLGLIGLVVVVALSATSAARSR
jgi:ABC-type dipeptide/oligopeptide/nickel transport system permease subunit